MRIIAYILFLVSISVSGQGLMNLERQRQAQLLVYDTSYQAILNEATALSYTLPSSGDQIIQNKIIVDLKANGLWTGIDAMFYFKGSGGVNFKKINWKNPTGAKATEVGAGALTWASDGVKGDLTNYVNLNWNPTDDGVNYLQNDFSVWVDIVTAFTVNNAVLDGMIGSNRSLQIRNASTINYYHSTGSGSQAIQNISGTGYFILDFKTNTTYASKNGAASFDTETGKTTDSYPNVDFTLFKIASFYGDAKVGSIILGGSLNGNITNYTNAYNSVNGI